MGGSSHLLIIFITVFIDLVGFGIIIPLLPLYAESLGATGLQIGLLSTSYALTRLIFSPVLGRLSDGIGRRRVIVLSLLTSGLAYLVFALSGSLTVLLLARIIGGAGSANTSVASAYIADGTSMKDRARGMGLISAGYNLGFIFGPAIGGTLSIYGLNAPIILASALSFSAAIFALMFLPESLKKENRSQTTYSMTLDPRSYFPAISRNRIWIFLAVIFLVALATTNQAVTLPLFGKHRLGLGSFEIGLLFMLTGIFATLSQGLLIGLLTRKVTESKVLALGTIIASFGFLFVVFSIDFLTLSSAVAVASVGLYLGFPLVNGMVSKAVPADQQGAVLGLTDSAASFGAIVGPILAGVILDQMGVGAPYVWGSFVMFVGFLVSLKIIASHGSRLPR